MSYHKQINQILSISKYTSQIRNVGVLAHIDHGKTTLSDNLLAYCGLLSPSLAGQARALDFLEEEQKRGITIKSANISLLYHLNNQKYVINLIDTPGHVDFSSARDQSLRVIDGAIIVVDAVEGCMVQTEIVTKQALEEYIKPILFINKIDRLITELKFSLKEIEERINQIIQDFNNLIDIYCPDSFKNQWEIHSMKDNIVFGSALHLWGGSPKQMLRQNIKFKNILQFYQTTVSDNILKIQRQLPLSKNLLQIIIYELPNPIQAQKYRIPNLWSGATSSNVGKSLISCDLNGPIFIYIYRNISDENLGIISFGRLFSGTLQAGKEVFSLKTAKYHKILQPFLFMGSHRESITSLSAGNIVAFNIDEPLIGDTLIEKNFEDTPPFENIKYESEAVVQYSIEPFNPREVKIMRRILKKISINDPNIKLSVNEETGEILISGLGELHVDVIKNELNKQGLQVIISEPIVTYRETIDEKSKIHTSSPDSEISIQVEPLDPQIIELLTTSKLNFMMSRNRINKIFLQKTNWDQKIIQNIIYFDNWGNLILLNGEKNHDTNQFQLFFHHFEKLFRYGPLIHDPLRGIKVTIHKLVNYMNIVPLLKQTLLEVFNNTKMILLEPIYTIQLKTIPEYIGAVSSIIAQRSGKILKIEQKGLNVFIQGKIPVKNTFGLSIILRSKTSGHIFWQTFFSHWEKITPESQMQRIIQEIRAKRGIRA
ncbi:MAG: GTP-binding protein [Candidatus Helarchaeota archaeon]